MAVAGADWPRTLTLSWIFVACLPLSSALANVLFARIERSQLAKQPRVVLTRVPADECARLCLEEKEFRCASFDYSDSQQTCNLHNDTLLQHQLVPSPIMDHYKGTFQSAFTRFSKSFVPVYATGWLPMHKEQCAHWCLSQAQFVCKGFLSRMTDQAHYCLLSNSSTSSGLQPHDTIDFYERKADGPLSKFINYGSRPFDALAQDRIDRNISLHNPESCATFCLDETEFRCVSADYDWVRKVCYINRFESANIFQAQRATQRGSQKVQLIHYERTDKYTEFFFLSMYQMQTAVTPIKRTAGFTVSQCAKSCLEETVFVCRSFNYEGKRRECQLNTIAAGDFGTLSDTSNWPDQRTAHYYEFQPRHRTCGGKEQSSGGYITSSNWPYDYVAGSVCKWNIEVSPDKVILMRVYYLTLGGSDHLTVCSKGKIVTKALEEIQRDSTWECLNLTAGINDTPLVISSSMAEVTLRSQEKVQTQRGLGFVLGYDEGSPSCNQTFRQSDGTFTSPFWPQSYPKSITCVWRIVAFEGSTITLTFSSFSLEGNASSAECPTRGDYVEVYGGQLTSKKYCGDLGAFSVAAETSMTVVLISNDLGAERPRFQAAFRISAPPTPKPQPPLSSRPARPSPPSLRSQQITTAPSTNLTGLTWPKRPSTGSLGSSLTSLITSTTRHSAVYPAVIAAESSPTTSQEQATVSTALKFKIWGVASSCLIVVLGISVVIATMHQRHKRRKSNPPAWVETSLLRDLSMETYSENSSDVPGDATGANSDYFLLNNPLYIRTMSEDDGYMSDIPCRQSDKAMNQQRRQRTLAMSMQESFY